MMKKCPFCAAVVATLWRAPGEAVVGVPSSPPTLLACLQFLQVAVQYVVNTYLEDNHAKETHDHSE